MVTLSERDTNINTHSFPTSTSRVDQQHQAGPAAVHTALLCRHSALVWPPYVLWGRAKSSIQLLNMCFDSWMDIKLLLCL